MFPVRVRVVLAGLAVAVAGAVAALVGPAGPAVGQSSQPITDEIQVSSPATLVARGAGADVTVIANCSGPAGTTANVTASLSERSASAVGSTRIDCTGASQTLQVVVAVQFGRVLKKGTAIGSASINPCTPDLSFCDTQSTQATIQVVS